MPASNTTSTIKISDTRADATITTCFRSPHKYQLKLKWTELWIFSRPGKRTKTFQLQICLVTNIINDTADLRDLISCVWRDWFSRCPGLSTTQPLHFLLLPRQNHCCYFHEQFQNFEWIHFCRLLHFLLLPRQNHCCYYREQFQNLDHEQFQSFE